MSKLPVEIGLIYDYIRPDERLIIDAAKKKGIKLGFHDVEKTYFSIVKKDDNRFEDVILQRCIGYFRGLHLSAILEGKGIKVVNSYPTTLICGNKALTSITLSKAKVPTPKTLLAFTGETALNALEELGYPAVLKPVIGSWGRLIAPLKDIESARAILETREYMFPLYQVYYIQEMIKKTLRDIRCFVIGNRPVAAIYRYPPPGDWITNIARGGRAESCPISPEIAELSSKAADAVGGGALGIDLIESDEGILVHEVNPTTEFKTTMHTTGIDVPSLIIDYLIEIDRR